MGACACLPASHQQWYSTTDPPLMPIVCAMPGQHVTHVIAVMFGRHALTIAMQDCLSQTLAQCLKPPGTAAPSDKGSASVSILVALALQQFSR